MTASNWVNMSKKALDLKQTMAQEALMTFTFQSVGVEVGDKMKTL